MKSWMIFLPSGANESRPRWDIVREHAIEKSVKRVSENQKSNKKSGIVGNLSSKTYRQLNDPDLPLNVLKNFPEKDHLLAADILSGIGNTVVHVCFIDAGNPTSKEEFIQVTLIIHGNVIVNELTPTQGIRKTVSVFKLGSTSPFC